MEYVNLGPLLRFDSLLRFEASLFTGSSSIFTNEPEPVSRQYDSGCNMTLVKEDTRETTVKPDDAAS